MALVEIQVNSAELARLGADIDKAKRQVLGRLAERGYQLLRREIKRTAYETGNLEQGVAPPGMSFVGKQTTSSANQQGQTDVDYEQLIAELTVSARSGSTKGGVAEVFDSKGKPTGKRVSLRPSPAFNYAQAVARGRVAIAPKHGKALLIPVPSIPKDQGYLLIGGKPFVVRKSAKAVKANPFDERAATKLEAEATGIADAVLSKFV